MINKTVTEGFVLRTENGMYLNCRTAGFGRFEAEETYELRYATVWSSINRIEQCKIDDCGFSNTERVPVVVTRSVQLVENNS